MEPISLLISALKELADRVGKLGKIQQEDKQQVFEKIIEPLFTQLEPVVENYRAFFGETKNSILNNPDNLFKVKKDMYELRTSMQIARRRIEMMAFQISKMYKDEHIQAFAKAIIKFFDLSEEKKVSLNLEILEELFSAVLHGTKEKSELVEFIDGELKKIERNWVEISLAYSALQIHHLSPKKFVKK